MNKLKFINRAETERHFWDSFPVKYDRFIGKNAGIVKQKAEKEAAGNIEFNVEGACKLSFPNRSVNTITASNVFHLLFDPEAALKSLQIGIDTLSSPI